MSNQNTALIPTNEPVGQLQDTALNQFIDTEPVQTGLQWSHSIELLLADCATRLNALNGCILRRIRCSIAVLDF